ncbi:hypothetical protein KIW84_031557 [Lathyrus oleraceus]|uniref:Integrase catalytic domain-containing protein n=1 Tax=Pisum sativum TaxID=3888 RepID=A0A9D5AVD8_PEA|nr:hypothetical protein KIW84_031557 [Pisum sativum]
MWGIDMIGMIEPKASNGHRFILVAIDYFTKWVEAASYANVTRPKMNGAVEAANKNIKKIIQKMVVTYKDWHEMPHLLCMDTSRYDQLNLIEEKRLTAMCHGQLYQQRMKKAFDKKVKPRVFREGDLVLKKVLSFAPDSRGKWTPNYEGPYVVKRAFSGGALILTTMDGEDFTRPMNSDAVKKYFA